MSPSIESRPDGVEETVQRGTSSSLKVGLAVALVAAQKIAERIRRSFEEAKHASETARRQQEERLDKERSATRSALEPVTTDQWWETASEEDIGAAYTDAAAWSEFDPDIARIREHMDTQCETRYGVSAAEVAAEQKRLAEKASKESKEHTQAEEEQKRSAPGVGDVTLAEHVLSSDEQDNEVDVAVVRDGNGEAVAEQPTARTTDHEVPSLEEQLADLGKDQPEAVEARMAASTDHPTDVREAAEQAPSESKAKGQGVDSPGQEINQGR
ncbi:MAG: hypothetical protein L0G59_12660 [Kocuria sp.]|nr:hypothetical protein [Kocuria sp.]